MLKAPQLPRPSKGRRPTRKEVDLRRSLSLPALAAALTLLIPHAFPDAAVTTVTTVTTAAPTSSTSTTTTPKPAPRQDLPPGAIKHPGQQCWSHPAEPPDGQGCAQRSDRDCVGNPRQIGECMAARRGYYDGPGTGDQWSCIDQIVTPESGWDPLADNPDGAHGIPQALPGSKMATEGDDWWFSPLTQLRWLYDRYLPRRYGTPCNAAAFRANRGWY